MSGDPYGSFDYTQPVKTIPKPVPHGAKIEIHISGGLPLITHRTSVEVYAKTESVKSYPDGMVVGCNFISNEALDTIWGYHQQYIKDKQSLTHQ